MESKSMMDNSLYADDVYKSVGVEQLNYQNNLQDYLTDRLKEAGIPVNRGVKLETGTKRPAKGSKWRNLELPEINDIDGHFGIRTGNGLVVIDVDDWNNLPKSIQEFVCENPTLTIESAHSDGKDGHYYYSTDSNINKNPSGCDIQGDGSLVADGSEIWGIRDGQDCKDGCCSKQDPGEYTIKNDRPITHITTGEIEAVVPNQDNTNTKTTQEADPKSLPDIGTDKLQLAQSHLRTIQSESTVFFNDLIHRLQGETGDMGDTLIGDDGKINRSKLDYINLKDLIGVFEYNDESPERSRELAYITYTHYSQEHSRTADYQTRKWVSRSEDYRKRILNYAVRQYDGTIFNKMLNKTNGTRKFTGEYADLTYQHIDFAIDWLINEYQPEQAKDIASIFGLEYSVADLESVFNTTTMSVGTPRGNIGGLDNEYPTPRQVRRLCSALDKNDEGTYERAMKKFRKQGGIKWACLKEGVDYRVYPSSAEDPPNAEKIKTGGERICPDCSESMYQHNDGHYCPICEVQE